MFRHSPYSFILRKQKQSSEKQIASLASSIALRETLRYFSSQSTPASSSNCPTNNNNNNSNVKQFQQVGASRFFEHDQNQTSPTASSTSTILVPSRLVNSKRLVQFRKTSEMFNAVNSKHRVGRDEWVTKSTADYADRMKIAKAAGIKVGPRAKPAITTMINARDSETATESEKLRSNQMANKGKLVSTTTLLQQQQQKKLKTSGAGEEETTPEAHQAATEARIDQHRDEFEKSTYEHWDRIRSFRAARNSRWKNYFASYGWGFFTFYCMIYALTFAALYYILKAKILDYRGLFEYVYCATCGAMDRPQFFEKMEQVDPRYLDLSFTFMLNEIMDMWRFPFAFFLFMAVRNWWARLPGKTMFRDLTPEKGIEFDVKLRDKSRKNIMRKSTGGTVASAATAPCKKVAK